MEWPVSVIFEDNHLLVVNKPAGLLVQGDRSGDPTLLDVARDYVRTKYDKPGNVYLGLVHRLDRNVSGVVVLARTSKAASRLSDQFRRGVPEKVYLAVVQGCPSPPADELKAWLGAQGDARGVTRASLKAFPDARQSTLSYSVLERNAADTTLVEIRPRTGRRHQIRAQMALIDCPLLGDIKYGATERLPERRIALHALRLTLQHPVGTEPMTWQAPLPEDWPWPSQGDRNSKELSR